MFPGGRVEGAFASVKGCMWVSSESAELRAQAAVSDLSAEHRKILKGVTGWGQQ
jgi:hypothetical protein